MTLGCIQPMAHEGCGVRARRERGVPRRRNEVLYRSLKGVAGMLRELRNAGEPSFRRRVEQHVDSLLGSGPVRVDGVARDLGCSRQTLYRRLKSEGSTFEQLLAGLRRRRALELVNDRGLPIKEIAYRLGFSDPASFSRAFKRWTGTSPQSLRSV